MPFLSTAKCLHQLKWLSLAYLQQLYGAVITARAWMSICKDLIHDIVWTQRGVLVCLITHVSVWSHAPLCDPQLSTHVPHRGYQMRYVSTPRVNNQGSCNVPYVSPIISYFVALLFGYNVQWNSGLNSHTSMYVCSSLKNLFKNFLAEKVCFCYRT